MSTLSTTTMGHYELIAILSPNKQNQKSLDALNDILKQHDVKVEREEKWGEKKIYHPTLPGINKGFYVYKSCRIAPEKIKEISKDLLLDSHILRVLFKVLK